VSVNFRPESSTGKEQQLRTALEEMRDAIDHYHGMFIRGKIMAAVDSNGYPPDLQKEMSRNPISLVKNKGATRKVRKARSLTTEQFHALLKELH
jgi:hypothetical protein